MIVRTRASSFSSAAAQLLQFCLVALVLLSFIDLSCALRCYECESNVPTTSDKFCSRNIHRHEHHRNRTGCAGCGIVNTEKGEQRRCYKDAKCRTMFQPYQSGDDGLQSTYLFRFLLHRCCSHEDLCNAVMRRATAASIVAAAGPSFTIVVVRTVIAICS